MRLAVVGPALARRRDGDGRGGVHHRQLAVLHRHLVVRGGAARELVAFDLVRHGAFVGEGDAARDDRRDLIAADQTGNVVLVPALRRAVVGELLALRLNGDGLRLNLEAALRFRAGVVALAGDGEGRAVLRDVRVICVNDRVILVDRQDLLRHGVAHRDGGRLRRAGISIRAGEGVRGEAVERPLRVERQILAQRHGLLVLVRLAGIGSRRRGDGVPAREGPAAAGESVRLQRGRLADGDLLRHARVAAVVGIEQNADGGLRLAADADVIHEDVRHRILLRAADAFETVAFRAEVDVGRVVVPQHVLIAAVAAVDGVRAVFVVGIVEIVQCKYIITADAASELMSLIRAVRSG